MSKPQLTGYSLSRSFFDWCFENPEKVKPNHIALYFFIVEHCNRLGWKRKFGLPTDMCKDAIGIKSYNTYIKTLNELIDFGFINMIQKSKNQWTANIIELSNFDKALDGSLDKAIVNHSTKQIQSTGESIDSIDKQSTNKQSTNKTKKEKFTPPEIHLVQQFIFDSGYDVDANKFWNYYESNGWKVGKNQMKDWKASIRKWNADNKKKFSNKNFKNEKKESRVNGQTFTTATRNSEGFG